MYLIVFTQFDVTSNWSMRRQIICDARNPKSRLFLFSTVFVRNWRIIRRKSLGKCILQLITAVIPQINYFMESFGSRFRFCNLENIRQKWILQTFGNCSFTIALISYQQNRHFGKNAEFRWHSNANVRLTCTSSREFEIFLPQISWILCTNL